MSFDTVMFARGSIELPLLRLQPALDVFRWNSKPKSSICKASTVFQVLEVTQFVVFCVDTGKDELERTRYPFLEKRFQI